MTWIRRKNFRSSPLCVSCSPLPCIPWDASSSSRSCGGDCSLLTLPPSWLRHWLTSNHTCSRKGSHIRSKRYYLFIPALYTNASAIIFVDHFTEVFINPGVTLFVTVLVGFCNSEFSRALVTDVTMCQLIICVDGYVWRYLPLNPATGCNLQVDIPAPGTNPLIGHPLPHHNTDLEFHPRLHHACEFRWTNYLAIFSTDHFVVTSFDIRNPHAISAIELNTMIEILDGKDV